MKSLRGRLSACGLKTILLAGVFFTNAAIADNNWGWTGHHDGMIGYGWFFSPLMLIIYIALAVLLVRVYRGNKGGADDASDSHSEDDREDKALQLLRERFARGEISREEFEAAKKTLE